MDRDIRKKKILDIILRTHIDNADPVGSRYISDIMGLSSATIRNIMAELEEEGYVEQPYTSAGRIPTERAYRSYVNVFHHGWKYNMQEIRWLNEALFEKYYKYNELIERTASAVSQLTNYTAFVIYPKDHIYVDGAYHMLDHPEFCDLKAIRKILKMFDEKERLLKSMSAYISAGTLKIHIGKENPLNGFELCSVVTASYRIRNKIVGGVGVIGPIRMKYRRIVPMVKYLADSVSRMLDGI